MPLTNVSNIRLPKNSTPKTTPQYQESVNSGSSTGSGASCTTPIAPINLSTLLSLEPKNQSPVPNYVTTRSKNKETSEPLFEIDLYSSEKAEDSSLIDTTKQPVETLSDTTNTKNSATCCTIS